MSNILNEPFDNWVRKQVETRQMSLGKGGGVNPTISPVDYQYQNTKTPFLRLASSVNLYRQRDATTNAELPSVLKKLVDVGVPEDLISGDELAQNFILQGGAISNPSGSNNLTLNSGLTDGNIFNGAYGWGGISERGYVPMPGITDADVTYFNNGALSKTTINIKCFSKAQFQLVDVLYLRPGYTLLMEFGWSNFLTNADDQGNYSLETITPFRTNPLSLFLSPNANTSQYTIYTSIEKEREKYYGNYDAIYGKISKFNWQFNPDGSYDCQVQLTSVGDAIESLKTNITPVGKIETPPSGSTTTTPGETPKTPLVANKNDSVINQELWNIYQSVKSSTTAGKKIIGNRDYTVKGFRDGTGKLRDITFKNGLLYAQGATTDDGSESPQVWIKYGAFLAFIQAKCLLYDKTTETPMFTFDMNFDDIDNDENVILTIPGQISSDPRVCLIPIQNSNIEGCAAFPSSALNDILRKSSFQYKENNYLGRISNLFININYLANTLKGMTSDEEGKVVLLDYLKSLNKGMIQTTGGINKYDFKLSQSGLKVQIIEDIPQRFNSKKKQNKYTKFNVFGVKPGIEGSFIRNIDLTADLSNNFATMISIGAQQSGNQISENATSFSNYNAGLKDRIIKEKTSSPDIESQTGAEEVVDKPTQLSEIYLAQTENYNQVINQINFLEENILALKENFLTATQLALGILTSPSEAQLSAPFFLPFNLSLEMDGLSGMALYQKFEMTDDILPPSYEKNGVELSIKGINHSINSSAWITKIDTLSTPKFKETPVNPPPKITKSAGIPSNGTTPGNGNTPPPPPGEQPTEDEKLRLRLTRVMDDGTQTLGYLDVLAEDEKTILYTLATSELSWKNNANSISCVPTDLYRVKSNVSPKYKQTFLLDGNEAGGFAPNAIVGNGYTRNWVLIHEYPKAPGWAQGCIGPGLYFNETDNQKGRQKGTGKIYTGSSTKPYPVVTQSRQAVDKIINTLYSLGSFKMTIENNGGIIVTALPTNFSDPSVQSIFKSKGLIPNRL